MPPLIKRIDLHIHSHYSDGTLSPQEIMELARKRGIAAVAITDHDTVAGTPEAFTHGRNQNVEVVSGVEIGAEHNGVSMHILGFGFDYLNPRLQESITILQEARRTRNQEIILKLKKLGVKIDLDELNQHTVGQIGRPHIARLLVKKGVVRSANQAFFQYLKKNGRAFAKGYTFSAAEAIDIIRTAGGLAFLAHPASIDPTLQSLPALLRELKDLGLAGLELYYPGHSAKIQKILRDMGKEEGLLFSGGSDFHGAIRKDIPLGGSSKLDHAPYDLWLALQDALKSGKNNQAKK